MSTFTWFYKHENNLYIKYFVVNKIVITKPLLKLVKLVEQNPTGIVYQCCKYSCHVDI